MSNGFPILILAGKASILDFIADKYCENAIENMNLSCFYPFIYDAIRTNLKLIRKNN